MPPKIVNGSFETGTFEGWGIGALPQFDVPVIANKAHSGEFSAMLGPSAFVWQRFVAPIPSRGGLILEYWLTSAGSDVHSVTVALRPGGWILPKKGLMRGSGIVREQRKSWRRYVFPIPRAVSVWAIRLDCGGIGSLGIWLDDVCFRSLTSDW
jgi:hypothetical protein